jgi:hypothetical protein
MVITVTLHCISMRCIYGFFRLYLMPEDHLCIGITSFRKMLLTLTTYRRRAVDIEQEAPGVGLH